MLMRWNQTHCRMLCAASAALGQTCSDPHEHFSKYFRTTQICVSLTKAEFSSNLVRTTVAAG